MDPLLSLSCRLLILLPLIGVCLTKFARADGVRSELHIFHHSCALKKAEGPCRAMKDRFYFDIDTGRCELFEYGGCQGNANNFETLQECEDMCHVKAGSNHMEQNSPLKPEEEEAKPRTEPLTKHEYSPLDVSHVSLQKVSQPAAQEAEFSPPEICMSPVDRGDCDGSERRYVYNPRTGRCQAFRYSGCGGNKNNFVHKRHCMKMCTKDHGRRKQIRIKTRNSNILFRSV
ncbi:tissue factor pathway inhibitor a isoform X4 [Rhinichthys klamathensis goyatoka]|uniref:tissue factor pathway inhibitor a isoform X4 n=1 Tax=Rhinichthys klamathensis goyatoka TaxID=3034132 RepID=UPI0024B634EE|nr:tissue factor pathway inhibitor a isoform X4 [Rhinichthys klamathensis goyatoka]